MASQIKRLASARIQRPPENQGLSENLGALYDPHIGSDFNPYREFAPRQEELELEPRREEEEFNPYTAATTFQSGAGYYDRTTTGRGDHSNSDQAINPTSSLRRGSQEMAAGPQVTQQGPTTAKPQFSPPTKAHTPGDAPGGLQFWLIMVSLMATTALSALDLTAVSTALPVIVEKLHGTNFAWVGAAYSLGSTAFLPWSGGLAQIFGRRPVVVGSIAVFTVGSIVSASARSMNVLIGGRALQGIGGGGILSSTQIIVSDLVPLRLRGPYIGLLSAVWAIASAIGPPLGGVFAQHNWRWLFYINIPLCAIAMVLVFFFLHLKAPQDDFRSRMRRMDWIGNALVIGSTTSLIIAFAWAGVEHPWTSAQTLVPLLLGAAGMVSFFVWEAKFAIEPVVPWELLSNRTSAFGYASVFWHGVASTAAIYFLPVFFQGALLDSPVKSGVTLFGMAFTVAPGAIACGLSVAKFRIYKPQNYISWVFTIIGFGLFSMVGAFSPKGWHIGFQLILGLGVGANFSAPNFPVLAALPVTETAHALALFAFVRSLAQTFGVTIGSTILQNELKRNLPAEFLRDFAAKGVAIAYSVIPVIPSLPEPLRVEVQVAFAESVQVIWRVMIAVSFLGLLCVLGMKELKMHEVTHEDWGMADGEPMGQREKQQDEGSGGTPYRDQKAASGSGATTVAELLDPGFLERGQKRQRQHNGTASIPPDADGMRQSGLGTRPELPYRLPSDMEHLGGNDASPLWEDPR